MTLVNQTGCLYNNGDKTTYNPKYENMKVNKLFTTLVKSQANTTPFDWKAEEEKIQEQLKKIGVDKLNKVTDIVNKVKELENEVAQDVEEFL